MGVMMLMRVVACLTVIDSSISDLASRLQKFFAEKGCLKDVIGEKENAEKEIKMTQKFLT